ncbi:MAG: hypothetical protein CL536_00825 [Alcaligenaceae bacterium]|nr:hypothetical protein [Alcaligenaceae bacterium]
MRLLWVDGITNCKGARSWTSDKLFNLKNVTVSSVNADDVCLYLGNATQSTQYFAHEADRFASAAFETLHTNVKSESYARSTGWLLIKAYYAAFFAVHSLMRLHGWACTRLSSEHLKSINSEVPLLFPGNRKFTAGLYLIRSESGGRELRCSPLDSSKGGSHEILWSLLHPFFNNAIAVVLSDPNRDGQTFAVMLSDFLNRIDRVGGPKWFTATRNRLNYAHEYGAWFPYAKSTCDYDRLQTVLASWSTSPTEAAIVRGDDELIKFAAACSFLVSLCCATVRDLTYRSNPSSPFRKSCGLLV